MSSTAFSIGVSGMRAAQAQLTAAASNIANAGTTGAIPAGQGSSDLYAPVDVVSINEQQGSQPGPVGYRFTRDQSAYSTTYDPASADANAEGMVATPQIDVAVQLAQVSYAKAQFMASARVASVAGQMEQSAIDMLT